MSRIVIVASCACALGGLWTDAAWAQQGQTVRVAESSHVVTRREADATSRIRKALEEPTKMDFTETQLSDVVNFLKDFHHIEIQLDTKALDDASIGPETPVTRQFDGIPLRSALRLMLGCVDLTAVVGDDVLLITTSEKAKTILVTKIYPVGDLLTAGEDKAQDHDFRALTQAIRSTIAPHSWQTAGGLGDVVCVPQAQALVVMQTDEGQQNVAELLGGLRKARDVPAPQAAASGSRARAAGKQAVAEK